MYTTDSHFCFQVHRRLDAHSYFYSGCEGLEEEKERRNATVILYSPNYKKQHTHSLTENVFSCAYMLILLHSRNKMW